MPPWATPPQVAMEAQRGAPRPPERSAASLGPPGHAEPFHMHDSNFVSILGMTPCLRLIASTEASVGGSGKALFHEAGVWCPAPESSTAPSPGDVWITSNILRGDGSAEIKVGILSLAPDDGGGVLDKQSLGQSSTAGVRVKPFADYRLIDDDRRFQLVMANGGTAWEKELLFCCQGQDRLVPSELSAAQKNARNAPFSSSALVAMKPSGPARVIVNHFHGRAFNSINDVCYHRQSKCIFFTDPDYGYEQGFKDRPQLPNAVWRYDLIEEGLSMVADGFKKPNGIVFSPDGLTCYITDTDFIRGDGDMDGQRAATIYAYDVRYPVIGPPHLHSRRVFAFVDCGAPDGIKCDEKGNVYTGCFDGVHVFAPSGVLLGKIILPLDAEGKQRGCANLVFGPPGRLIILSETTVWEACIAVTGDLKGVEPS